MTKDADKAMSKSAFEKIKAGLEEAKAYLDGSGDKRDFQVHVAERKGKSA
jgi:putative transcriptional regulator